MAVSTKPRQRRGRGTEDPLCFGASSWARLRPRPEPRPSSATATSAEITLKGSIAIITEFFNYSINSILYQRGIYPPESFSRSSKYGLTVLTSDDEELKVYLKQIMGQMEKWMTDGDVERLVVVVTGVDSGETLERWQFNVSVQEEKEEVKGMETDENGNTLNVEKTKEKMEKKSGKSLQEIHFEISALIRQITASVTFLPLLNEPCSFDLLIYTKKDASVDTSAWEDSDPRYIVNSSEVKLRSFTTSVHKVDSCVAYKEKDEWDL
ncbi:hypothetical protein TrLO_g9409 [Triparma laevis f. longispina]|uniref:HORMA domain-containing protein n=1 Tax=Triparma laevis f. longispina TaxID=1714387 RepID=A0A9W7A7X4_9STRA|nr:hypothetical protein TrLO_g9409 [Triparma laevis f. longispina]